MQVSGTQVSGTPGKTKHIDNQESNIRIPETTRRASTGFNRDEFVTAVVPVALRRASNQLEGAGRLHKRDGSQAPKLKAIKVRKNSIKGFASSCRVSMAINLVGAGGRLASRYYLD